MSGQDQYAPPPGPPPGHAPNESANQQSHISCGQQRGGIRELASNNPFSNAHINAPQGPPPSNSDQPPEYQPPPGPPPSNSHIPSEYQPPPGPPPSSVDKAKPYEDFAPPQGPPPSHQQSQKNEDEPPPYDPWMAVPDTALLPPPPSLREEISPTANASEIDAAKGHAWCHQNPLWSPRPLNPETLSRIAAGDIRLTKPPGGPNSKNVQLEHRGKGKTHVRTSAKCTDTIFLSDIPVYSAISTNPGQSRTLYYELRIIALGAEKKHSFRRKPDEDEDAGIALGFLAPPYPSWRLPGWHRASLGVHSDDGRRYVDDTFGGVDFVSPFRKNDVVGIGMTFSPPGYQGGKAKVDVFFTRNGKREGGWNLHEERDKEQDGGDVSGLEGRHDLLAAVGCFGVVEFEVRMGREEWMFRPST